MASQPPRGGQDSRAGAPKLPQLPPRKQPPPSSAASQQQKQLHQSSPANAKSLLDSLKSEAPRVTSREANRSTRELHDLRVMGLAPLAVDSVTGDEISPHVPRSVAAVPWYHSASATQTLVHQRKDTTSIDVSSLRDQPPSYTPQSANGACKRVGSCKNCGASTHQDRDCTERRRALRNRDGSMMTEGDAGEGRPPATVSLSSPAAVSFLKKDDLVGIDPPPPPTNKSLRAEESTLAVAAAGSLRSESRELPKYLFNLNSGSSLFDPMTRTMRGNPQQLKDGQDPRFIVTSVKYEGDAALARSGGSTEALQQMLFAYDRAAAEGNPAAVCLPTANALAFGAVREAEVQSAASKREAMEAVYGPALLEKRPPSPV